MGQSEVIDLLEKQEKPLSLGEIAKMLEENPKKIPRLINKLLKYHEIEFIEIDRKEAKEKYHCKRRMRIYYVKKH